MEINAPKFISNDDRFELQKVFSVICSSKLPENQELTQINYLNEHNVFTSNNVTAFVQAITKNNSLTKKNVGPLIPLLDTTYSGLITWEAFTVAMDEFMTRTNCFEGIYKKRSSVILGYDEKRIFHSAIANFFSINTDETVNNLDQLNMFLVGNTASYDFQMIDHEKDPSLDKQAILLEAVEIVNNFGEVIRELSEPLSKSIQNGFEMICRIFRIVSYAANPLEIATSSKIIAKTLELMANANIYEIMLKCIIGTDVESELKLAALKTLSFVTCCFRFKFADFDGINFVRNNQFLKINLFHPEFLKILSVISCDNCIDTRYQALLSLAFIVEIDDESRNILIQLKLVENLSPLITADKLDWSHFEAIGCFVSSLVSCLSFAFNSALDKSFLLSLVDVGYKLISTRDQLEILKSGFSIIGPVANLIGVSAEVTILFERILEILKLHNSILVKKYALIAIKDIIENSEQQTQILVDLKLLPILVSILNSNEISLKYYACRIMHFLVKTSALQLLEQKTLASIQQTVADVPHCRWECIRMFKSLIAHSQTCVNLLVENGIIKLIFFNLSNFRELDEILLEAYNYQRYYMNLPFLIDCLSILNTILQKGVSKSTSNANLFADYFDRENIDKLQVLVEELFEDPFELKSQINRSYVKTHGDDLFERLLVDLIINIRLAHKNKEGDMAKAIIAQLNSLLFVIGTRFQELEIKNVPIDLVAEAQIEVRCMSSEGYPNGDNRIVIINRNISYEDFKTQIQIKYNYYSQILIKFIDRNNEIYTIDGDLILQKAITECLDEFLANKFFKKKPEMRVIIEFLGVPQVFQPDEVQCVECGKRFEVVELYEPINPGELYFCVSCREETNRPPNSTMNMNFSPYPAFTKNYPGFFYK